MIFPNQDESTSVPLTTDTRIDQKKHRFMVLDIFRGLFAFFVFLFHLRPFAETPLINNAFIDNCDLFVDFFFVLSGFVIALNYLSLKTGEEIVQFIKRRLKRIYPLHFFMLLLFLLVAVVKPLMSTYVHVHNLKNAYDNVYSFISSLLLLNSTGILVEDVSWNIASWSISAEMIAYLLFAVSIYVTIKVSPVINYLLTTIGVIVVSLLIMKIVTDSYLLDFTFDYGYLRGIIGFFTGILCYYVYQKLNVSLRRINDAYVSMAECAMLVLLVYMIYNGGVYKNFGLTFELLFFTCILIFSLEKGIISNSLKRIVFLNNLGKYSYSIYLTHTLMISLFNVLFIRILKFDPSAYAYLFLLNFGLIYFFSSWTYKHIEMKFYHSGYSNWLKNTSGPK